MTKEIKHLYLAILKEIPVGRYLESKIGRAGCDVVIELTTHKLLESGHKLKFRGYERHFYLENIDE